MFSVKLSERRTTLLFYFYFLQTSLGSTNLPTYLFYTVRKRIMSLFFQYQRFLILIYTSTLFVIMTNENNISLCFYFTI